MIKNKSVVLNLLIVAAIFLYILISINNIQRKIDDEGEKRLVRAIEEASTLCFSIEGFYPANIDYLIDNYQLVISDDYHVYYVSQGANFKPEIKVLRKE